MALLVTLIVLLILAGISLNGLFIGEGIFNRTKDASSKYNESKAREVLETVLLGTAQYEKRENSDYDEEEFLDELIKREIPGSDVKGDIAIIGEEYAFELDRSVPKIGYYLGKVKDLIFPKVTVAEKIQADSSDSYKTAKIVITATIDEKAENGINRIEIWQNGIKLSPTIEGSNEKTVTTTYSVNKNGEYTVKAYSKITNLEIPNAEVSGSTRTTVEGIVPAVEFSPNGNKEWKKSHTTTVKVSEKLGKVSDMKYLWKKIEEGEPQVDAFTDTESCANNSQITGQGEIMTGKYCLWVLVTLGTGTNQKKYINGSEEFYFDNEGPEIELSASSTSTSSIAINFNLTDENVKNISSYSIYIDGELKKSDAFEKNPGSYIALDVAEGTHSIKISAEDSIGNVSQREISHELILYKWNKYQTKLKVTSYDVLRDSSNTRCSVSQGGDRFRSYGVSDERNILRD